jgi:hypothetical protein
VGRAFSPLDEELALLPGALTPSLQEGLVRLGAWLPFAQAADMLAYFTRVRVAEATARRTTEAAGAAYVAVQTAQVEAIEREAPPAPAGPALQYLSADGAMAPLVGGAWAEVKTLAIGTVGVPVWDDGEWVVHTADLSYFSRMTDAATFTRLAAVETHRRGTATATAVAAVMDGAEWEQGFTDHHRPDAVRILDCPHAIEYVAQAAQAGHGVGTPAATAWLEEQRHELRHGDPQRVLDALREVRATLLDHAGDAGEEGAAVKTVTTSLEYLTRRQAQIRYAAFAAAGYPLASGATESANKVVVEARLKGAGMHWAPAHVDPMVALRTVAASDRWAEAWPQILPPPQRPRWRQSRRCTRRRASCAGAMARQPRRRRPGQRRRRRVARVARRPIILGGAASSVGEPPRSPARPPAQNSDAHPPRRRSSVVGR